MKKEHDAVLNNFRHEGPKHEGPKHEGPKHEGPKHEGPKHEGPRHEGPRHEGPKQEENLEHHMDELLIRISGNKKALNEIKQVVIEFKNNKLEKSLPKPVKEEKGKVLCERKK